MIERIKIIVEKDEGTENERIESYFKSVCNDAFKKGNDAEVIVKNEN